MCEIDLAKLDHKRPEFSALNPFETFVFRARRRDPHRRDDRDLPLYRGALAGAEPVWLDRARAGDDRDVAVPARMAAPFPDRAGRASQPSESGGDENPQVPDWAAANRPKALHAMAIVDEALRDRPFIAGDRFTVADITGLVALVISPSPRGSRSRPSWFTLTAGARR